jgi:hypothetical protein
MEARKPLLEGASCTSVGETGTPVAVTGTSLEGRCMFVEVTGTSLEARCTSAGATGNSVVVTGTPARATDTVGEGAIDVAAVAGLERRSRSKNESAGGSESESGSVNANASVNARARAAAAGSRQCRKSVSAPDQPAEVSLATTTPTERYPLYPGSCDWAGDGRRGGSGGGPKLWRGGSGGGAEDAELYRGGRSGNGGGAPYCVWRAGRGGGWGRPYSAPL